jgi:transposase
MIDDANEAEILRLYHAEKWPVNTIAVQLDVHHDVVERVLRAEQSPSIRLVRPSMLDAYVPFIQQKLEEYPTLRASRLYDMCVARGYKGGPDYFRHRVRPLRPKRVAEAFLRRRPLPAEEAQVDWGHFGRITIGRAHRPLMAFVMVLSWSRMVFLRFFLGAPMECFLRGHVLAFEQLGGVARVLFYDNLKTAVLERRGDAIRFHPRILALSKHYRFEPRPVAVARGNEKGRVERAIRFVRESFFPAREWKDLADLNEQARAWCEQRAASRPWVDDRTRLVRDVHEEEKRLLMALPENPFPTEHLTEAKVGKSPYARFDGNDYSVPHTHVRRALTVAASETRVRILEGTEVLADHGRSYDRGETVEEPAHIDRLVEAKRRARKERASDRLTRSAPSTEQLLGRLAHRGANLGSACGQLLRLLDEHGADRLERAAREALEKDVPEPRSVRLILNCMRLDEDRPARVPVALPDDPRVTDLVVRPHSLETYDVLGQGQSSQEELTDEEQ